MTGSQIFINYLTVELWLIPTPSRSIDNGA